LQFNNRVTIEPTPHIIQDFMVQFLGLDAINMFRLKERHIGLFEASIEITELFNTYIERKAS
jgi:hypothetical protein